MADTLTLLQLRDQSKDRADMVGSSFISDTTWNSYINSSLKELWDLLIDTGEDYALTSSATLTLSSGNILDISSLTTFYKLKGVDDMSDPNNPRTVKKFMWNERNDFGGSLPLNNSYQFSDVMYRLIANTIIFEPPQNALKPYRIWYHGRPATLTLDADTADGYSGWLEYVIIDAAIKAKIKEESDTIPLEREKAAMKARIEGMARDRDQGLPEKVSRVRSREPKVMYNDGRLF